MRLLSRRPPSPICPGISNRGRCRPTPGARRASLAPTWIAGADMKSLRHSAPIAEACLEPNYRGGKTACAAREARKSNMRSSVLVFAFCGTCIARLPGSQGVAETILEPIPTIEGGDNPLSHGACSDLAILCDGWQLNYIL